MPEVWEQEGHLRARPCFRGDIEEELKRVDVDRQHTEAARTTTGTTASAEATATFAVNPQEALITRASTIPSDIRSFLLRLACFRGCLDGAFGADLLLSLSCF
jgi:hypothetical protein